MITKQLVIALILSVLANVFLIFNLSYQISRFKDAKFNVVCLSTSYEIVPYTRTIRSQNGELDSTFVYDADFYHFIHQRTMEDNSLFNIIEWVKFAAVKQHLFMINNTTLCYSGPDIRPNKNYYEGIIFNFNQIEIDSI